MTLPNNFFQGVLSHKAHIKVLEACLEATLLFGQDLAKQIRDAKEANNIGQEISTSSMWHSKKDIATAIYKKLPY